MSAQDYKICPTYFSVYIAKIDKRNPSLMTSDRREFTENEILMLIDWYLDKNADSGEGGLSFDSFTRNGMRIFMQFKRKEVSANDE